MPVEHVLLVAVANAHRDRVLAALLDRLQLCRRMEVALRVGRVLEQQPVAVAVAAGRLDLARRVEADPGLVVAVQLERVGRAARDDDVVLLAERHAAEHRAQHAAAAVHVDHLVALAVAIEAVELLHGLADRHLEVAVEHQEAPAAQRVAARLHRIGVGQPVHVRVGHPFVALDRAELADRVEPAGRVQVVEDRLVAGEALVAHDLLGEERRAGAVPAHLHVALAGDLAEALVPHRFPLRSCSRSIASKSALKLPSPKPRDPCRSMTSKKIVGRSPSGFVKICSR